MVLFRGHFTSLNAISKAPSQLNVLSSRTHKPIFLYEEKRKIIIVSHAVLTVPFCKTNRELITFLGTAIYNNVSRKNSKAQNFSHLMEPGKCRQNPYYANFIPPPILWSPNFFLIIKYQKFSCYLEKFLVAWFIRLYHFSVPNFVLPHTLTHNVTQNCLWWFDDISTSSQSGNSTQAPRPAAME